MTNWQEQTVKEKSSTYCISLYLGRGKGLEPGQTDVGYPNLWWDGPSELGRKVSIHVSPSEGKHSPTGILMQKEGTIFK